MNFQGRYYRLVDAYAELKPMQKPHPPFAIGAEGEQALRVVSRHADIWDCSVDTPEAYRRKGEVVARHCAGIGRDPATIERARHISVDPTNVDAARTETETFIRAGATHIIFHVPVQVPGRVLYRLAEQVAEPLYDEFETSGE